MRVAIVGVGYSEAGRSTDLSYKELTAQSALAAMADAGMGPTDIDGICLRSFDQPEPWGESPESAMNERAAAHMLGITPAAFFAGVPNNFGDLSMVGIAAVASGMCHTCIVIHPCRTKHRLAPGGEAPVIPRGFAGDFQFAAPYGAPGPGMVAGLTMQRHMAEYGTTEEQFGLQQVSQRHNASLNPEALLREPITVDDYLASRWISRPVRLLDCDYPCDVSSAVIFTTEERASQWRKPAVYVEAAAMATTGTSWEYLPDILATSVVPCAEQLWSRTDLVPGDVDCAQLYDGFSVITFSWLEALGFCGRGESGPFVESGATSLGGSLPVNTDGGVCNLGRRHGASHCIEAVRQIRGECGARQVPGAEVSVFTVAHGPHCYAALLSSS
ncbi:MAG TPA: thiolase family protein [Acidimicrobiales bacterium]